MTRTTIAIETRDGRAQGTVFRPDIGEGPWPSVLVYHDGRGIRPAQFELAQRIASAGYLVLLPDLFYRAGPYTSPSASDFLNPEVRKDWQEKYSKTASKANWPIASADSLLKVIAAKIAMTGTIPIMRAI